MESFLDRGSWRRGLPRVRIERRARFAGSWVLLVTGGGPTPDKPLVTFAPPAEPDRVSQAMTLRVDDCNAAYEALKERGAEFLTPPYDSGGEVHVSSRPRRAPDRTERGELDGVPASEHRVLDGKVTGISGLSR